MIRRLLCRLFGHSTVRTPIKRGKLRGVAIGCRRCDTLLGVESTSSLPRMAIPRSR